MLPNVMERLYTFFHKFRNIMENSSSLGRGGLEGKTVDNVEEVDK